MRRPPTPRRLWARRLLPCLTAAALAGGLGLAGCTDNSADVASLGTAGPKKGQPTQADTARALVKCMDRAGIEMELMEEEGDQASVMPKDFSIYAQGNPDGGWGAAGDEGATEADWDKQNQLMDSLAESKPDSWILVIDGEDVSEAFDACVKESGYTEPEFQVDPVEDAKQRQLDASAGAKWAACAREHGYPNIKDPVPGKPEDDYPTVVLPFSMTEEALEALVAECPTFDRQVQEDYDQKSQDPEFDPDGSEYPRWPNIDFDYVWPENPDDVDPNIEQKWDRFWEILFAEQNAYYDSLSGDGGYSVSVFGGG